MNRVNKIKELGINAHSLGIFLQPNLVYIAQYACAKMLKKQLYLGFLCNLSA